MKSDREPALPKPEPRSDEHFAIDPDKIEEEKKFDGIFVCCAPTPI
ncbi:MAG TPA: hypothetical protein VFY53_11625 [Rhodoplanes sp.]|nr:hypothetical protein [Rhodoplanes sp.]